MALDVVLCRCALPDRDGLFDVGVADGTIAAVAPSLTAEGLAVDLGGRLVCAGFVEAHIHLDKACIIDRCDVRDGTLDEAIRQTAAAKRQFTVEDIHARGAGVLERAICQGTVRLRTHVEVDPRVGLRAFEAVMRLKHDFAWAIDVEVCAFAQEGLTNDPGSEDLLIEACAHGADVVGGCPYTDTDPRAHIKRIFDIAERFDLDVDFHLDFDLDPSNSSLPDVLNETERRSYGGRVMVGHATKLSMIETSRLDAVAKRMANAGVGLVVLPATDLYLTGREYPYAVPRGVAPAHRLARGGVTCALASNNVMNPFTPFGDASLVRMANLFANVAQLGTSEELRACFAMITSKPAKLMNRPYGIKPGAAADLVVLDAATPEEAVAGVAPCLAGWKAGRLAFGRAPATLYGPGREADLPSWSGSLAELGTAGGAGR